MKAVRARRVAARGWLEAPAWFAMATSLAGALLPSQAEPPDTATRCRALGAAQDAGSFDTTMAIAALGDADPAVVATAAAIVRHEWSELPNELLQGIDGHAGACLALLAELAAAPRPSADWWVTHRADTELQRGLPERLLAIAARSGGMRAGDRDALLAALARDEEPSGFLELLEVVPEPVADGLVGQVHRALVDGRDLDAGALSQLFDRLSPRGVRQLLGLCVALPPDRALPLARQVAQRRPELVRERAVDELDGSGPFATIWLDFAVDLCDRPARVARVVDLLRADDRDVRRRAFAVLLGAKAVDAQVLQLALADGAAAPDRIRALLHELPSAVPAARFREWLRDPALAEPAARALLRLPSLPAGVADELAAQLAQVADGVQGSALAMLTAMVQSASAEQLAPLWPLVPKSPAFRDLFERAANRRDAGIDVLLFATADALDGAGSRPGDDGAHAELRGQQQAELAIFGASRGHAPSLQRVLQLAPTADAVFLRRCRAAIGALPTAEALRLCDCAIAAADPFAGSELLEWAALTPTPDVVARLESLWQDEGAVTELPDELRGVVLGALLRGPRRSVVQAKLRAALRTGPLTDTLASAHYLLLDACPQPLVGGDLQFAAECVLWVPLVDPDGERRQVHRWPEGHNGFPLVAAVAHRLRGADPAAAAAAFAALVDEVLAATTEARVSRQRLSVLWRTLVADRPLQQAIGEATWPLWFAAEPAAVPEGGPDAAPAAGAAHWFAARAAERREDFGTARIHYEAARAHLLRLPWDRHAARLVLGERDVGAGVDPFAALAAAPHRMRMLLAIAAGDRRAAAAAQAFVRDLAGRDAATIAASRIPLMDSVR